MSAAPSAPRSIAIIGGGVMGLGIGWRLAMAGVAVSLFESGSIGRGASWAAAGMLAAGAEAEPGEEALFALNRQSQLAWPAFRDELENASGQPIGYRDEGTLVVASTRDEAERLRHEMAFQRSLGVEAVWLEAREMRRREPYLSAAILGGAHYPADHQVDNRLVVTALTAAFKAAGGAIHEASPVERVETTAGRASGVIAGGRLHAAEAVLLAAGAWSGQIGGLPPLPSTRPIKGQLLALEMGARPILRHTLWAPRIYLVPRTSGRLVIGATVEEAGFSQHLTAGGLLSLLDPAWRALPAIEELPVSESWVGFRPGSPDDAPLLGETAMPGLFIAAGHHRNGILLLPITVAALTQLILTGAQDPAIRAFGVDRFNHLGEGR